MNPQTVIRLLLASRGNYRTLTDFLTVAAKEGKADLALRLLGVISLTKIYVIYLWKYCWIIFIILQLLLVEIITIRLFSIHAWAMRC